MRGKKSHPTPQDFDERGNFVGLWKRKSDDLFDAASTVWHTQAVGLCGDGKTVPILIYHRPAYLLMGLCLEALLKGLLVGRDPQLIRQGKVSGTLISHDIRKLLDRAKIPLASKDEEEMVTRLTTSVVWMSKYPIPTVAESSASSAQEWGDLHGYRDNDFGPFMAVRERVLEAYRAIKYVQILRYEGPLVHLPHAPRALNPVLIPVTADSPTPSP